MKKCLSEKLICPECLRDEIPLNLEIKTETDNEVLEGRLICPSCKSAYPIQKGIAVLLPEKSKSLLHDFSGYNSKNMLSSYLWSHFSDMFKDPAATEAYQTWASFFKPTDGMALDIGCAVGRLSFELSKTHAFVVGIDTSISFIEKARELMHKKKLVFDLIVEGFISEKRGCDLDADWNYEGIDFIVADALALPFPGHLFSTVTSINILEKVPSPIQHLKDVNRVLRKEDAMFVFSDPFSWDESVSHPDHWLSGGTNGHGNCRGVDSICRYFAGKEDIFYPTLDILETGNVAWKIRKTENLWEHINSQLIVGSRQ